MQTTVAHTSACQGLGLHTGRPVSLTLAPAPVHTGIVFVRTDLDGDNRIPALWNRVADTRLCTVIANEFGASVGTIEHLMAALRGCGIDNVFVHLDGPEVPVMDGSSAPFVALIDRVGIVAQAAPRRAIKILDDVIVEEEGKRVRLSPAAVPSFSGQIDFAHPVIGRQFFSTTLLNGYFRHELSQARTFGFAHEVEALRAAGLARGGSLENAIVLDERRVLNKEGLRYSDEFIRHKLLDAVGDLYLAGAPIIGAYECYRPGHAMNNALLHKLFANRDAWMYVDPESDAVAGAMVAVLPHPAHAAGAGVA